MATLEEKHLLLRKYIDNIRNKDKRAYAEIYYKQVIRNGLPEPSTGSLSYMGAQDVRLRISEIMKGIDGHR